MKGYINGKIYTVDKDFRQAEAFLLKGDRFLLVGANEEILSQCGAGVEVIDLQGKTVLPGLIDSHLHVVNSGIMKLELNVRNKSREEIKAAVAEAAGKTEKGRWIIGRGWNNDEWEDRSYPTKEELDVVAPEHPVYLKRACGHASWGNSEAFRKAGITENTPDPAGGEILRNPEGKISGMVTDQAQEFFNKAIPPYDAEQHARIVKLAEEEFLANGLTTIHDAGTAQEIVDVWDRLYAEGQLKVRIYVMLRVPGRPTTQELLEVSERYFQQGIRIGAHENRLTARCFKLSNDGSLGARSAWMLEDYSDRPGHRGNGKLTDDELYRIVKNARKAGFQVAIHAIGDAANRQSLNIYERVFHEIPGRDHRYRIEHAQIVSKEDIPRFAKLGVIPTFQSIFVATDKANADDRLGPERIKGAYAWRTFRKSGCILPNGTDSPVELMNPFINMYVGITRKDLHGNPAGGWYPEESLTRQEAVQSYTTWSAYAGFEEHLKGSIERGKLADFVILDTDIMTCAEDVIKDIRVLETIIGGETVFKRP
jgi:predicted amidohydrolase YtcJ